MSRPTVKFEDLPTLVGEMLDQLTRIDSALKDIRVQLSDAASSNTPGHLMTYAEIAQEFRISLVALKRLKRDKKLVPITKGGKHLLFDRQDVITALANRNNPKPNFSHT